MRICFQRFLIELPSLLLFSSNLGKDSFREEAKVRGVVGAERGAQDAKEHAKALLELTLR